MFIPCCFKECKDCIGVGYRCSFRSGGNSSRELSLQTKILAANAIVEGVDLNFLSFILFIAVIAAIVQLVEW